MNISATFVLVLLLLGSALPLATAQEAVASTKAAKECEAPSNDTFTVASSENEQVKHAHKEPKHISNTLSDGVVHRLGLDDVHSVPSNDTSTVVSSENEQVKPAHKEPKHISNTLSDGVVHELGLDNFHSVIGDSSYTFVLFYDADEAKYKKTNAPPVLAQKRKILEQLAADFAQMAQPRSAFTRNLRIHFAVLDTRRHSYLRKIYLRWPGSGRGKSYEMFYQKYSDLDESDSEIPTGMIGSTTFMNRTSKHVPTFPSEWAIFHGADFSILNCIDKVETVKGKKVDTTDYDMVKAWLVQELLSDVPYTMQGPHQPRLPCKECDRGPGIAITSFTSREKIQREDYIKSDPLSGIDWEAVDSLAVKEREASGNSAENKTTSFSLDPESFAISRDDEGHAFFKYRYQGKIRTSDGRLLEDLADATEMYLAWANSYENLWSTQRKAQEDERTNYGYYLGQMNNQLRDVLFSTFQDLHETDEGTLALFTSQNVPQLETYFADMLFGYGRSPSSLNEYLKKHLFNPSKTIEDEDVLSLPLFQRIREYMHVREEVGHGKDPFEFFLQSLVVKFNAILSEFHTNLTLHYIEYLEAHDEERKGRYDGFQEIDRYDMKDPSNFELLTNYDEFQSRYVAQGKPFVLSNVELTKPFNFTLDFLVEKCGFVDVTSKVRQSKGLGDKSVQGWGGLNKWHLHEELTVRDMKGKVSLEQFIELSKRLDYLYLHDFQLKTSCSSLLFSETPYDPPSQQYFHIPAVIGRFDLFQRLPKSSYGDSWPSLFIGRKGTNSKVHIDSGATGFWMWLASGRKRWVIYDEGERPYLYERLDRNCFIADVLALNATSSAEDQTMIHEYMDATYPLMSRANAGNGAYEIIQNPGEIVYIPPNSPHAVENLEDIVGISFNQVPKAGLVNHLFDLIHVRRDFAAVEVALRHLLSDSERAFGLADSNPDDPLYTTLGEYVAQ